MVILFLCRSLWIFAFCRFFISLCFSNIFAYVIFFWFYVYSWIFLSSINWLFMFFLYFNPDLVDAIFWNSQAWNEELQNMKSLKEQKTVSLFLCISLWIFAFFFRFFILLCFSDILASSIFWELCVFLNFLVINELSITLVTAKFQIFEGNSWSCSMCLILFFYFYGDFLFILYSSSTFTHIYSFSCFDLLFFCGLTIFIQDFWRPKNSHSFSLHISLNFCFLSILHLTVFL